ncbi:MAG: Denitrification system component NirT [Gammaproteobacteria bacterium]|nr:Denitrification system component NirT [Gammaproteobacteria bacterium]
MSKGPDEERGGWWRRLLRPSPRWSLLTLLVVGFIAGVLFWGGFHTVIEATNTEQFCISCHEMRDNVYAEYAQNTIHYTNRTGVRAVCSDCHVPKEWGPKMLRKMAATKELYGKITGSIETREKFLARRLELAQREWRRMKANDSLECRNCHTLASMDVSKQKPRARRSHEMAVRDGETCIDCHKGTSHQLPENMPEEE